MPISGTRQSVSGKSRLSLATPYPTSKTSKCLSYISGLYRCKFSEMHVFINAWSWLLPVRKSEVTAIVTALGEHDFSQINSSIYACVYEWIYKMKKYNVIPNSRADIAFVPYLELSSSPMHTTIGPIGHHDWFSPLWLIWWLEQLWWNVSLIQRLVFHAE